MAAATASPTEDAAVALLPVADVEGVPSEGLTSGLGISLGSSNTTITDMLSRLPNRKQRSIKHSDTAPKSHWRGGCLGIGGCSTAGKPSRFSTGSTRGSGGRPFCSIPLT